jgi:hypothetical protein
VQLQSAHIVIVLSSEVEKQLLDTKTYHSDDNNGARMDRKARKKIEKNENNTWLVSWIVIT